MFRRSRKQRMKAQAGSGTALALGLAQDRKFRKELLSALGSGAVAQRRARRKIGTMATLNRLAVDEQLRDALGSMTTSLKRARGRFERKRSRRMRKALLVVGAGTFVAALYPLWRRIGGKASSVRGGPRTISESIEVEVPLSTAYNQWTQFEDFPQFMEGVEQVRQLDDTRLHWVATVGGKRAEWDAKILEQRPDRQISWVSEDGKATRGTVSFEELGPSRTRIELSMSYVADDPAEAVGSAAGLDSRRVRGDLDRFRDMIEAREKETGAWRGEVVAGEAR